MAEAPIEAEVGEEIPPPDMIAAPEEEPQPDTEIPAPPPSAGAGPVIFRDRYVIDANTPLPNLDTPSSKAYAVEDRRDPGRKLFGLVCTPGLPTRTRVMGDLKDSEAEGLLPMVEWDSIHWPLLSQKTMIVIYDQPVGGRVLEAMKAGSFKFNEYEFPRRIIAPLVEAVKAMSALDHPHRQIRPNNVFFLDEAMQTVVLGDCATVPWGFDQPMLYETADRAMAQPGGRGRGGLEDDIYALGATLVVLMLGYNPVSRIGDQEMLRMKLEIGSYAAICGEARLPIPMLEPLRGMLNDAPSERWGLEELEGWLAGRKQSSIKHVPIAKSDFPYTFNGRKHVTPRTLAHALARNRDRAMDAIRDDALQGWLRKGIGDASRADGVKAAIDAAALHKGEPQGTDDYVIAKVCMVLDPDAPVRYKGFSFMPDGYGPALAVEVLRREDAKVATELVTYEIPELWYGLRQSVFAGASVQQSEFARMKGYLRFTEPGYGWERCLYEINPSMPCQSPYLIKDYVVEIEDLLPALNEAADNVDTHHSPLDRHISAFIAARFDEDIHPHLRALAAERQETSTIGMLSLLAFLQWKLRHPPMFALSSWVGGLLGPAINTYHSRSRRREIEKEIPRLVRKGSLPELFDLIDNADNRRADTSGFEEAVAKYTSQELEIREIEGTGTERQTKAERAGKQTAAVMSIVMSMIVISVLMIAESF